MTDLDWSEMEGLFCQQAPMAPTSQNGALNFRLGNQDANECDKKRKEPTEVTLLIKSKIIHIVMKITFFKNYRLFY